MAAINIKNLPTGAGDDIKFDASYAVGDTKNVFSTSAATPNFLMLGGTQGQLGPNNTIGFGAPTDAIYCYRRRWRLAPADHVLRCPWCVQPQLGSLLVVELVRRRGLVRYQGNSTDLANGVISATS